MLLIYATRFSVDAIKSFLEINEVDVKLPLPFSTLLVGS